MEQGRLLKIKLPCFFMQKNKKIGDEVYGKDSKNK